VTEAANVSSPLAPTVTKVSFWLRALAAIVLWAAIYFAPVIWIDKRLEWPDVVLLLGLLIAVSPLPSKLGGLTLGDKGLTLSFIAERQREQDNRLDKISFILRNIVTSYDRDKLKGLAGSGPFMCYYSVAFVDELRHLRGLGFIKALQPLHNISERYKAHSDKFDLKDFCEITPEGQQYLTLLQEDGTSSSGVR
jgi:hypothetical protein